MRKHLEIFTALLVAAVVASFFWEILFRDVQFYHSDTHGLMYPLKQQIAESLRSGHLPLWDPFSLCGYPIIGSYISAVFLPHNLLLVLLPFPLAFSLWVVLKHILAAVFQFLFLRQLQIPLPAAAAAGIAFALSGPLLSVFSQHAFSYECLPLMTWLWWRVLERDQTGFPGKSWWAAVAGFAFTLLHGDLQIFYTGCILAFLLPLAREGLRWSSFLFSSHRLLLMLFLVAGLTSVQILPSAGAFLESDRLELSSQERLLHSLSPGDLQELVIPRGLEEAAFSPDFFGAKYLGLASSGLAIAALFLAVAGRVTSRRRVFFFSAAALTSLLLAMGSYFPLLEILSSFVPGLNIFRYPQKWLAPFSFLISTMAALGLANLPSRVRSLQHLLAVVVALDLILVMGPFLTNRLVDRSAYGSVSLLDPQEQVNRFSNHQRILRLPTLGDLGGLTPGLGLDLFDRGSRSRSIAWNQTTLLGNTASRSGLRRIGGLSCFRYRGVERLWSEAIARNQISRGIDLFAGVWVLTSEEQLSVFREREDLFGVVPDTPGTALSTSLGRLLFLERPAALDRALVVTGLSLVLSPDRVPQRLFDPQLALEETAVVVAPDDGTDPNWPVSQKASGSSSPGRRAEVHFSVDEPARVVLEVDGVADPGGFLLLNDTYDPGWQARVNGIPQPIYQANGYARAVQIPSGSSQVEFLYRPASLIWGAGISLTFLALCMVLFLGWGRRKQ